MLPVRLSIITCNLWMTERWNERVSAIEKFLEVFRPDIFCVQELKPRSQAFLDAVLDGHERVHDALPGWSDEGNLWWNGALLEHVEHGAEDVMQPQTERRLFWARLRLKDSGKTLFVSTAHLSSPTLEPETSTGQSPRIGQLQRICACLQRLVRQGEPAFFMGDMNDARHPQRILKQAGFISAFAQLGLQSPPTFKCFPTANVAPGEPASSEAIDLIVANAHARALAACVPNFFYEGMAPSDHWPVQAVYEVD